MKLRNRQRVPKVTQVPQFLLPSYLSSLATLASLHEPSNCCRLLQIAADYCEFRLCMTPADYGRRQRHRAKPIPLSNIYERSLSVKEKTKISFFPSASRRKKRHGSRNIPTVITGASATLSATVFSKKRSLTSTEPMKLRTSFSASATISISLPVPSTQDLYGRLTSEKPNRRCKKYGNR